MSVRKRGEGLRAANGSVGKEEKPNDARTDLTRWRLKDERGRQTWHYLETDEELKAWPLSVADRYFMGLETVSQYVL